FKSGEFGASDEVHQDGGQIGRGVQRYGVEHSRLEEAQTIIEMSHFRAAVLFVVNFNLAVLKPDVACIPLSLVFVDSHERLLLAFPEGGSHAVEIDGKIRIAVENKKLRTEKTQ